jgi:SHS2 domain-containing protein
MGFRFVDHTAELELELDAPSRSALFAEAVRAMAELLAGDGEPEGARQVRELSAAADDDPALLAAWLDEILFVSETDGLVPLRAERLEVGRTRVHGALVFAVGSPPHLVKGVTFHHLELSRLGARWHGRVVLDV